MYNDPDIGIEWPFELIGGKENLIISEKDLNLMSFMDYCEKMREKGKKYARNFGCNARL